MAKTKAKKGDKKAKKPKEAKKGMLSSKKEVVSSKQKKGTSLKKKKETNDEDLLAEGETDNRAPARSKKGANHGEREGREKEG